MFPVTIPSASCGGITHGGLVGGWLGDPGQILGTTGVPCHDRARKGASVRYLIVAEAYRDLEQLSSRLALTERLATLVADTPAQLLPTVCYLCQGLIAPEFAGLDLGMAEKLAVRAVATVAGTDAAQVAALVREAGDLGKAVEGLLSRSGGGAAGGAAALEVAEVVHTLREIAVAEGAGSQGRKLGLLGGLLARATPLEARYLLRLVTRNLRLGIGTPTIL